MSTALRLRLRVPFVFSRMYTVRPSLSFFLSLSSPRSYIPEARLPVVRRRTTRTFPRLSFTVRVFSLYIYNISISLSSQITKRALVLFSPSILTVANDNNDNGVGREKTTVLFRGSSNQTKNYRRTDGRTNGLKQTDGSSRPRTSFTHFRHRGLRLACCVDPRRKLDPRRRTWVTVCDLVTNKQTTRRYSLA